MLARSTRALAVALPLGLVCGWAAAQSVSYTGSDYSSSGLGADFPSTFDIFAYTTLPGSFADVSTPKTADVGMLSFVVGYNCTTCSKTPSFDTPIDFTVNGVTNQIDLQYQWSSIGSEDTLSFATPAPLTYDLGSDGILTVSFDALGKLSGPDGTYSEDLRATFAVTPVPEPSTYALMLVGLAGLAVAARRRAS
jgi:hypothetical protein